MSSGAALAASVVLAVLAIRSWRQVARYWTDPAARVSRSAFARYLGPEAQRRLQHGSVTNAICLTGLAILLLGGVWLAPVRKAHEQSWPALALATGGLMIFLIGFLFQLSIVLAGRPAFLLPRHARFAHSSQGPREQTAVIQSPTSSELRRTGGSLSEITVRRDEADSFGQLRRYRVYIDGEFVAELKRGETCVKKVPPGRHFVKVKISWCSSPEVPVWLRQGERKNLTCRAVPGLESDPSAVFFRRKDFIELRLLNLDES